MSIEKKIRTYILENYLFTSSDDALENSSSFLEEGIVDSTGIIELISFLQKEFSIAVKDDEMIPENLDSVNNIVTYVVSKR